MNLKRHVSKIFDAILNALASFSGILVILIMLCVTVDVIFRYFLGCPQFWVGELSEYALLYITFTGTAWVLRTNDHVKIDILRPMLSEKMRHVLDLLVCMICIVVCVVLAYYGVKVTLDHFTRGIYNPSLMSFPKAPLLGIIPFGALLLLIVFIRNAFSLVKNLKKGI